MFDITSINAQAQLRAQPSCVVLAAGLSDQQATEATYLRVWPSSIPSYAPCFLPSFLPCLMRLIHNKRESREGGSAFCRSLGPSPLGMAIFPPVFLVSISISHVDGCMVAVERERINKARLRVPNLQSDQPIACKLIPFFFFGC